MNKVPWWSLSALQVRQNNHIIVFESVLSTMTTLTPRTVAKLAAMLRLTVVHK